MPAEQLVLDRGFVLTTIRIKFKKDVTVKFISHLDMMKSFQRAVRRAGLEAEYSHGFNPQMQMVFGAPLSLGFTSDAEYADFSFSKDYMPNFIAEELNKTLPAGLLVEASGIRNIKTNIMADIKYAEYIFSIKSELTIDDVADKIMSAESLPVEKTRKSRTKTVNVRNLVLNAENFNQRLKILVKAGNENNLNPRLLIEALKIHIDPNIEGVGYNRIEQYVEREGRMISPLSEKALETK